MFLRQASRRRMRVNTFLLLEFHSIISDSIPLLTDEDEEETQKNDNPLPGFLDPITLEEVERPAISPTGHVMDYKSWSRCFFSF